MAKCTGRTRVLPSVVCVLICCVVKLCCPKTTQFGLRAINKKKKYNSLNLKVKIKEREILDSTLILYIGHLEKYLFFQ